MRDVKKKKRVCMLFKFLSVRRGTGSLKETRTKDLPWSRKKTPEAFGMPCLTREFLFPFELSLTCSETPGWSGEEPVPAGSEMRTLPVFSEDRTHPWRQRTRRNWGEKTGCLGLFFNNHDSERRGYSSIVAGDGVRGWVPGGDKNHVTEFACVHPFFFVENEMERRRGRVPVQGGFSSMSCPEQPISEARPRRRGELPGSFSGGRKSPIHAPTTPAILFFRAMSPVFVLVAHTSAGPRLRDKVQLKPAVFMTRKHGQTGRFSLFSPPSIFSGLLQ
jgi:hypothetical protein